VAVVIVSIEVPEPVTLVGLSEAPRLGEAATARLTVPLKPPRELMVMVLLPELPCAIETDVGLAVIVKSWTFTVTIVLWVRDPLVPVTVTV